MKRVLVVGAGLYGATVAHQLTGAGHDVTVLERRNHIAGNAYTRWDDETGCFEHVYGAHIFHTDNERVWRFVNFFADFAPYRHIVRAQAHGSIYPFPINLQTLHQVFGVRTPDEGRRAMEDDSTPCDEIVNMEQHCRATIGNRLYEMFVEGYTAKQWGRPASELPASIIKRIPVRLTYDDTYFSDRWQGIPIGGYTALVENMLRGIRVELNTDFNAHAASFIGANDVVVYSGSIDEFFRYSEGALGYRSLAFERKVVSESDAQGCAVMNYCDAIWPWTRVIEHQHFTGARVGKTLISFETPSSVGEPFYPINTPENRQLADRYRKLAAEHFPTVVFGGRLGEYRYLDMHQVIASAMAKSRELTEQLR